MDDYLDGPLDRLIGKKTWAADLQEATLPYALLAFSLAVIAEPTWSITLFWASYAVGMRGDRLRPLPLGLTGWQEALLLGVLTLSAFGWKALVTSWAAIFSLQAVDDLLDSSTRQDVRGCQLGDEMGSGGDWLSRRHCHSAIMLSGRDQAPIGFDQRTIDSEHFAAYGEKGR